MAYVGVMKSSVFRSKFIKVYIIHCLLPIESAAKIVFIPVALIT